jgi:hypothetical protein
MHKLFAFPHSNSNVRGNKVTLPDHVALANELPVQHSQARARNLLEHGFARSIRLNQRKY